MEDNIKQKECEDMDWFHLDQLSDYQLLKDSVPWVRYFILK
jgi:hypothetical protein